MTILDVPVVDARQDFWKKKIKYTKAGVLHSTNITRRMARREVTLEPPAAVSKCRQGTSSTLELTWPPVRGPGGDENVVPTP